MFKYYLYRLAYFLANRLSMALSYRIAIFLSDLHYVFSFRDRRAVKSNLRKILPSVPSEERLSALTREVFRNFGKYLAEFLRMEKMVDEDFIAKKVKVENSGHVRQALDKGKGAIIVTAHIGNWEMGAVLLSVLGYPVIAIALPHKERPVNDLFNHQREVKGITVIPTSGAIRKCIEYLKENKVVAIVGDRDFSSKGGGEVLDFLGHKALIPKGAAIFSQMTGAPVIPTFLVREDDYTFCLSMGDPIFPTKDAPASHERETILKIMSQYMAAIEEKIRQHPTQWLMFREFCIPQGSTSERSRTTGSSMSDDEGI